MAIGQTVVYVFIFLLYIMRLSKIAINRRKKEKLGVELNSSFLLRGFSFSYQQTSIPVTNFATYRILFRCISLVCNFNLCETRRKERVCSAHNFRNYNYRRN